MNPKASSSDLSWLFNIFKAIGQVFGVLGWVLVALLVIWLVYYLMKKRGFFANLSLPERARHKEEPVIPSLFAEIKAQDLPADIIASALRCFNAGQHRLALAYLLHYSLSWAQQQHQVRLHRSMTERECKRAIDAKVPTHIHDIFTRLFTAWVSVAWGHPPPILILLLLQGNKSNDSQQRKVLMKLKYVLIAGLVLLGFIIVGVASLEWEKKEFEIGFHSDVAKDNFTMAQRLLNANGINWIKDKHLAAHADSEQIRIDPHTILIVDEAVLADSYQLDQQLAEWVAEGGRLVYVLNRQRDELALDNTFFLIN